MNSPVDEEIKRIFEEIKADLEQDLRSDPEPAVQSDLEEFVAALTGILDGGGITPIHRVTLREIRNDLNLHIGELTAEIEEWVAEDADISNELAELERLEVQRNTLDRLLTGPEVLIQERLQA